MTFGLVLYCALLLGSQEPTVTEPPSARDVFVAALEEFQGVSASTFESRLIAFVDRLLTVEGTESEAQSRRRRSAIILGLGSLFDQGDTLRKTPIIGSMFEGIAKEEEKAARDVICSHARLQRRHDAPKHFFLAAALSSRGGPAAAAQASLVKEFEDARRFDLIPPRGTGFSFVDLAYDHAGIRFSGQLLGWKAPELLTEPAPSLAAFLPDFSTIELPERIGWKRFQDEYRGPPTIEILDKIHGKIDESLASAESARTAEESKPAESREKSATPAPPKTKTPQSPKSTGSPKSGTTP